MTTWPPTTPLATGPLENNKRHGAWTTVDDTGVVREAHYTAGLLHGPVVEYAGGAVRVRGTYDKERRDGVWTTYHPSGAIAATETYVRGVRHGESVTYFESGQVETRGRYEHGARDGQHETFFPSGALERDVTYAAYRAGGEWYTRNAGRERVLYEDGRVAVDRTYERGEIHGKAIANNEDSRDHERDMVYGVRHGLDKDWNDEDLTETRYFLDIPEGKARPKQLASLATKLKKRMSRYKKWELVSDLADGQPGGGRLLWHLLREGLITGAELEDLWEDMADDVAATGADVVTLLSSIENFSEDSNTFPPWPSYLDRLVCNVYERDPGPIDAALPTLPKHLRDAVRTVRARFGHDERGRFDTDMADYLARQHATNGIGSVSVGVRGQAREVLWQRDGELSDVSLSSVLDANIANEAFHEFIELFTTREAYTKALLDVCLESSEDLGTHRIADAIQAATPVQFGKMLANGVVETDLIFALTRLRKDSPEKLLGWAKKAESDAVRTTLALVAADRMQAAGTPVPTSVDELLGVDCLSASAAPWMTLSTAMHRRDDRHFMWTEQSTDELLASTTFADLDARMPAPFALYRKVLAALPRERALAIVSRMFDAPSYRTECAIGLAAEIATPALVSTIIEYAQDHDANDVAFGLAALPAALVLPEILEAHASAKKTSARFWHLALLCTLAAMTERGEMWPEEVDDLLHFGPFGKTDGGMGEPYEHAMRKILHALPLARAQKIFDRGFAQEPAIALRTFLAIASHPVESVLRPAFALLLADDLSLEDDHKRNIGWALSALREDGARWARWILATRKQRNSDIRAALDTTLGEEFWTAYDQQSDEDSEADD